MKYNKILGLLPFIISLFTIPRAFAQEKKTDKYTKEALEMRYSSDKYYAESQMAVYGRYAWKNSWKGAKLSELHKKWGAPTKLFPDGSGGQVVTYENTRYSTGGDYKPGYSIVGYNIHGMAINRQDVESKDTRWSNTSTEIITIYVNRDGIITKLDNKTDYKSSHGKDY